VIIFRGGAEAAGLVGAQAYVDAPLVPLADLACVLNLDMVGRRFFESGGSGADATFGVLGLESSKPLSDALHAAAGAEQVTLIAVPAALARGLGMGNRSDDWPFRNAGVPAAHLSTGISADYHRPSDTVGRIRPAQLVRAARLTARAALAVASLPARQRR
jgi:Zn-dependent M28 family amino/carboxypeptidase